MKKFLTLLLLLTFTKVHSQEREYPVLWQFKVVILQPGIYELHSIATITSPYHIYSEFQTTGSRCFPVKFYFKKDSLIKVFKSPQESGVPETIPDDNIGHFHIQYRNSVEFIQEFIVFNRQSHYLEGRVEFQADSDEKTLPIESLKFKILLP